MRLVCFEWKKLFLHWPMLVLLVVFTLADLLQINTLYRTQPIYMQDQQMESAYHLLEMDYAGEMTTEKITTLMGLYRSVQEQVADGTATTRTDVEGTLTGNLHKDYLLLHSCFVTPMEYLYTYGQQSEQAARTAAKNYQLYMDRGQRYEAEKNAICYELLHGRSVREFHPLTGWQFYLHHDYSVLLTVLLLLYGISQVFSRDRLRDMDILIETTPFGGRRTMLAKLEATALFIAAVVLWFAAVDLLGFSLTFGLEKGAGLPVYAVKKLSTSAVGWSLSVYALVNVGCRLLGFLCIGLLFLIPCRFFRRPLVPMLVGSVIFLMLYLLGAQLTCSSQVWIKVLDPTLLLNGYALFGRMEFVNVLGRPVLSWQAALLLQPILCGVMVGGLLLTVPKAGRRCLS